MAKYISTGKDALKRRRVMDAICEISGRLAMIARQIDEVARVLATGNLGKPDGPFLKATPVLIVVGEVHVPVSSWDNGDSIAADRALQLLTFENERLMTLLADAQRWDGSLETWPKGLRLEDPGPKDDEHWTAFVGVQE